MFNKSTRFIMADPGISPTEIDPNHYKRSTKIPWFTILMILAIIGSVIYAIVAGNASKAAAAAAAEITPTATITATPTETQEAVRYKPTGSITIDPLPTIATQTPTELLEPTATQTPVIIHHEVTKIVEVVKTQINYIPVVQTVIIPVYMTVVVTATPTNTPTPTITPTMTQTSTPTQTVEIINTPTETPTASPTLASYP